MDHNLKISMTNDGFLEAKAQKKMKEIFLKNQKFLRHKKILLCYVEKKSFCIQICEGEMKCVTTTMITNNFILYSS